MKQIVRTLAVAAAVAGLASAASAGDWNNGAGRHQDLKGGAATPVPVPVPIQETFNYYFRGDFGLGMVGKKPTVAESGIIIGEYDTNSPLATSSFAAAHTRDNMGVNATIGMGMYLSPRWRADVTADIHKKQKIERNGSFTYTADLDTVPATGLTPGGLTIGSTVNGQYREHISTRATAYMVNAYYDLTDRGRFTPYVGAGIGVVHHNAERSIAIPGYHITPPGGPACSPVPTATCAPGATTGGYHSSRHFGLAASLMLGASYAFDHRTVLDINYRAMYMQGFKTDQQVAGFFSAGQGGVGAFQTRTSRIDVGDSWEHQIRAGLRFNIW